jgi:hypothetical protein
MASRRYPDKSGQQFLLEQGILEEETAKRIPPRSTRHLPAVQESIPDDSYNAVDTRLVSPLNRSSNRSSKRSLSNRSRYKASRKEPFVPGSQMVGFIQQSAKSAHWWTRATIDNSKRHGHWLTPLIISLVFVIFFLTVLLSAGILQRSLSSYRSNNGQTYDMQVGGTDANSWQLDHPMDPQTTIHSQPGPYTVLGNPSIKVDFINQVLATYHSPAANKGQALSDLGTQYGIDPAFALAFFMHESSFGTQGEATKSLSLGNLRCIPNFRCADNFAQFDTWEDGFKAWYQLIRNLYVAQWGLTTIDEIIPKYAPSSDNNNEQGYIAALKHALDTWHAGQIMVM